MPLQVLKKGRIGKDGYSILEAARETFLPSSDINSETLQRCHPGGKSRVTIISEEKLMEHFNKEIKPDLDELEPLVDDGERQSGAGNPFNETGRLAWVVNDPPDAALVVSDINSWKKYAYEQTAGKRKVREEDEDEAAEEEEVSGGEGEGNPEAMQIEATEVAGGGTPDSFIAAA